MRAGLAVPIAVGADVVGVLEFMSDEPGPTTTRWSSSCSSVGTQLGRVVERERSQEARLRTLIDNMPASVYLRDLDGRFILVNRQYEEFWGLSNDGFRGKTLWETDRITDVSMDPVVNTATDRVTLASGEASTARLESLRHGTEHVLCRRPVPGAGQHTGGWWRSPASTSI